MKIIKKIIAVIIASLTILSLFSCAVYNNKKNDIMLEEIVYETTAAMSYGTKGGFSKANAKVAMAKEVASEEDALEAIDGERKIAKSVSINAETKTFDSSILWLKKYVSSFNGIIDNSYVDTGNLNATNYRKNALFVIRIPAEKLDSFLGEMDDNLNVTFKQESISDVTEDYFDSTSRLNTLKIEEENLNGMLKSAKSVDEMIKVEDKLSEVRAEIENINRRIKNYDKQIDYSRVDVNISEVRNLTDTKADNYDFSKETLNKKLLKTFEDVKLFLKKVAAYLFINIPWIILGLIVIIVEIILYMIIKSLFFSNKKGKGKDDELDADEIFNEKESDKKKNKKSNKDDKKEEQSESDVFDKVIEEVNKVVLDESANNYDKGNDVDVEFYNKEQ